LTHLDFVICKLAGFHIREGSEFVIGYLLAYVK
jgi:hypothetical protein